LRYHPAGMLGERLERARQVRSELGAFFENARVPVIVVEPDGDFVTANGAALDQYGWSLDELVYMRIHDLMATPRPELTRDLERASREDFAPLDRRLHRRKDGSVVWVVPRAGPVQVHGKTLIVSVLQDVSALVEAEHETQQAQHRSDVVWDAAEHFGRSFALLDGDCRIVKSNRTLASWLSTDEAQLVGRRCSEVFVTQCAPARCPHVVALAENRRVVSEFTTRNGRPLRLEVWPAPPNDAGIATIHVAQDLSEERALRSRLATTDRLATLGRIAAGVAHEVNNPAAFVTLALPMVRERLTQGRLPEAMTLLDEATAAMGQINEVMHELGGVVRDSPRTLVELASVVSGAIRIASIEAEARARIVRSFEDGVVAEVRGPRIAQVVINLVLNAAQAIPPGHPDRHRIEVGIRSSRKGAIIEVSDTGAGIPDDVGDRLFQPFFTTRAVAGGTGLGLWLSRAIVEEEGGSLSWRNRPAEGGGGAVFTVELPLSHARPQALQRVNSTSSE
jgi:PAS domain S-box-containing protein